MGGNSTPTTPISAVLLINNPQDYEDFICTGVFGGNNFVYQGTTVVVPSKGTLEMTIYPNGIQSANGNVIFLCYDCSCNSPYSGITAPSAVNYPNTSGVGRPVIIGGGGLNG
tara:strand:- start:51 stop:386 length:336 start_codon:yes stop_codon:yes gene_type:complete